LGRSRFALRLAAAAALALAGSTAFAQELQPIPARRFHVTDLTGTLTTAEQQALEHKLDAFRERKGAQVAVLIVPTTRPEEIEQYSIRLVGAPEWRLGRAASDDGALLLVAKDDRALRIEVGYGLEGVLTDALSNRIIDETIVPHFRAGEFARGIDAGVDRVLAAIDGEELPPPDPRWAARDFSGIEQALPFAIFAVPIAGGILRKLFGRVLGPLLAGGVVFLLVWLVTRVALIALAFAIFAALFSAFAGNRPRGRFRRGHHGDWGGFGGGLGSGGFGGGGFGGGGFSAGGGGFGGGGASGRW
jgi:uncharacterized protein